MNPLALLPLTRARRLRPLGALLVLPALLVGCGQAPPPASTARAVRALTVEARDVQPATRYSASLEPRTLVELTFKQPGKVRSVAHVEEGGTSRLIQEGDSVRKGQTLAELDARDLEMRVRAAQAALESALAQARAAEGALAQATTEVGRARALFAGGTMPRAELDRAETALLTARAQADATRGQQLAAAEQAALARSAVEDSRLTSPVDGLVARRMVDVGELASPGRAAFTIIDPSQMRVVFGVPDVRVNALRLGTPVPVHVEALPGQPLVGRVVKVVPVADPQLRSFSVEVEVPNPSGMLHAGMVASVSLEEDSRAAQLLVPLASVVRNPAGGRYAVYVLDASGTRAETRPVELGDLVGNEVVVEKGLGAGERVVIEGAQLIRPGELVEVVP